ncbi:unnamed protein product [Arabidopsis lyrata]|uniref:F-box domain-containing protein n=1 Tax=Arabidopsis lyrata subsp. lyrata TaxID=81972 RepID=D7LFG5_ARALL|nr:hypothetical protein ARALYDRAFT_901521 [Arabidopsis lyrata subsp. lyrata]CAH8263797.1 unnamed protein product [Arabidopsis lyrata]
MAPAEKLPSYLVGEIIYRLPTKSLARFRAVSKTCNICSAGINDDDDDPRLERLVMVENHDFRFCGIGYDNSRPEMGYKVFGYDFYFDTSGQLYQNVAIYNCKSDACKFISNAPCFGAKHKIDGNHEAVAWMWFMTVSIPNLPRFQHKCLDSQPSYFIDNRKRLFVSTCDETGHACIYVVKGDLFKKIPIDSIVGLLELLGSRAPSIHLTDQFPSLFGRHHQSRQRHMIIEVRDITFDMPYPILTSLVHCDGLLLSSIWKKGFVVWNPCLRQKRLIENHEFRFCGLGYDNSRPRMGY